MRPSLTWPLENCVVEDQSWEVSSTKATDWAPKVILALENISKPFNRNSMQIKLPEQCTLTLGPLWEYRVGEDLK